MSSGSIPITPALGVVVAVLLVAAAAVVRLGGIGHYRPILVAGVRGAVQLLAVALVIAYIVGFGALVGLFIFVMFAVATRTAGRRITRDRTWWWTALPIAAGVAPVVALLLVSAAVPVTGLVLIPLVGQLIGGALTATALAGRRLLDELSQRKGEVEAALALGMTERDARMEVARPVAGSALVPALDQTRTVGTVTLPGAFVGMMLGGAGPVEAGLVQLFVLVGLLAVESVAIVVVLEIVARGLLTRTTEPARRRRR
ncbi:putative ABC transport system permease protein [Saccharopolyspora erythraea NRRL 2338]|uniref:ABC transport system permease protein n=2 Tax=Saccharopolyspora erythraea TaxID=1836 RepID=A4FFE2_SACEN|nr:ABC transporter permease [Saccharopolyspora erythraea]EQD81757.1 ABC transporter permease [Saccharopolyspora erythraea D]PFG96488.1 putative ABC transport system permease protein [Saccharopolyspora erythraea NRRL 2338]QRK92982.1 ABC transporter permease [Saccharopolyspora erythraea]CAM02767.1 putative ABC transport system permease protein [Saccharopolyspora erythraea NRRL 2338]